jgi:TetR/AcrR family transcriptional regulator, cholesterol catabolism regulator
MTVPEVSRRERKKDVTRQLIFVEAVKLFREKGFEMTTVDDICERADVAKGTFFNYFPKKEAVLAYLFEKHWLESGAEIQAIMEADRPVRGKLQDIYALAAAAHEEDRGLSAYVLQELSSRMFGPTEEHHARWHELFHRVLREGQARGEVRAEVDPEAAEAVLSGVFMASLFHWVCWPEKPQPLRQALRERLDLVFDGLTV